MEKPTLIEVVKRVARLRIVKANGFSKEPDFLLDDGMNAVTCVKMARLALKTEKKNKDTIVPKSAMKCSKCKKLPVWGAFFLVCLTPNCNSESEYNRPAGNAVKTWNKLQKSRLAKKAKLVKQAKQIVNVVNKGGLSLIAKAAGKKHDQECDCPKCNNFEP